MRHSVNPQQGRLFDPFAGIIPPLGLDRIYKGWQQFPVPGERLVLIYPFYNFGVIR